MAHGHTTGGPSGLPLNLLAQAIPSLTRHDLEALTERLIDVLDLLDGDLDIEPNGDELDGTPSEDEFMRHGANSIGYPGCPLADPDCAVDDTPCDEDFDREIEDCWTGQFCDPEARSVQRQRIRRDRCVKRYAPGGGLQPRPHGGFVLINEPKVPTRYQLLKRKRGVPRRPRG